MSLTRRNMLQSCLAASAALATGCAMDPLLARRRPNIVFIMADDIGFECYGAYGSKTYQTPRFDQLAKEGALFSHAYSQPLCTPSRVKLMTGKYNFRNYTQFGELNLSEPTFAKMLKAEGYQTCIAGKWQLSATNLKGPNEAGFDQYLLWHFSTQDKKHPEEEFANKGSRYRSPKLYRNGKLLEDTEGKYGPDLAVDFINEFIEHHRDEPFVVYYPMMLVHAPFQATPDSPDWGSDEKDAKHFPEMVQYMDKCIGRVVDKLDELGLREDTLIMVTGDNGTNHDIESPLQGYGTIEGGKGRPTDAGTHVGFVASWPGRIKPGTVIDAPIDFADVLPTMAETAGIPIPKYADGESLLPLLEGKSDKARGWVFISDADEHEKPIKYRSFVRDQRWKLYDDGTLFDLSKDLSETNPATGPEADRAREKLQPILDRILKSRT